MNKQALTFNLIILLIAFVLVWLWSWPLFERTRELRSFVNLAEKQLGDEHQALAKLSALRGEVEARQDRLEQLEQAIPAERDLASVLALFEEVANVNGLVLKSVDLIEPGPTKTGPAKKETVPLNVVSARLKLEGRYGSVRSFLEDVETTFPLMDVADISFLVPPRRTPEGEEEPLLNPLLDVTITLETYYRSS